MFLKDYILSLEPMGYAQAAGRFDKDEVILDTQFDMLVREIMERNDGDLIEVWDIPCCSCPECAKYQGRIYSLFGKDSRFPKMPEYLIKTKGLHCGLIFYRFHYGFSTPRFEFEGDIIEASNRPFVDDRPQKYKDAYYKIVAEYKEEKQDRAMFAMLEEDYPDIAPKSYSAYRRMKKAKTKGYLKLAEELKNHDIDLPL